MWRPRLTKRSDWLLSQSEEMEQLLMNLLDDSDEEGGLDSSPPGPPPLAPPLPGESSSEISEEDFGYNSFRNYRSGGGGDGAGEEKSRIGEVPMADDAIAVDSDEDDRVVVHVEEDVVGSGGGVGEEVVRGGGREEEEEEEETGLPVAVGEAVEFAEGEDPFDDSSSEGEDVESEVE